MESQLPASLPVLTDDGEWGDFLLRVRMDGGARIVEFASPPPDRGRIAVELLETDLAMHFDQEHLIVRMLGIPYRIVGVDAAGQWVGVERIKDPA